VLPHATAKQHAHQLVDALLHHLRNLRRRRRLRPCHEAEQVDVLTEKTR
jgi:hypothetical protein